MNDHEEDQAKENVVTGKNENCFNHDIKKTKSNIWEKNIGLICKDEIDFSCDQCAKRFTKLSSTNRIDMGL